MPRFRPAKAAAHIAYHERRIAELDAELRNARAEQHLGIRSAIRRRTVYEAELAERQAEVARLEGLLRAAKRCRRCGRPISAADSVDTGYGPDCRAVLGIDVTDTRGVPDVELELVAEPAEGGTGWPGDRPPLELDPFPGHHVIDELRPGTTVPTVDGTLTYVREPGGSLDEAARKATLDEAFATLGVPDPWPSTTAWASLEAFYGEVPPALRRFSPEVDYGVHWRTGAGRVAYRVSWVRMTGELIAVAHTGPDLGATVDAVELLAIIETEAEVEVMLEGWAEHGRDGIPWVRGRVGLHRPGKPAAERRRLDAIRNAVVTHAAALRARQMEDLESTEEIGYRFPLADALPAPSEVGR